MDILIKNATLVDYQTEKQADIYIKNGIIYKIGQDLHEDCPVIDATSLCLFPAFVDLHTHLRVPGLAHKEDIESGTRAAVRGGYTTLNAMANTKPVCSDASIAAEVCEAAKRIGLCDVYQCVSMTRDFDGKTTSHLDNLGIAPHVKCISEDGFGVQDGRVFLEALGKANAGGRIVLIHAEDADFTSTDMAAAEDLETLRDLYLIGGHYRAHFCHVSTKFSAQAIIDAKRRGQQVTMEVTPHHLALNDSVNFKVNPPLRPEVDRVFLVNAILSGQVDVIATDHAPHTAGDKLGGAPGLVGLETSFAVCYTELCLNNGLPISRLSELMSKNPSKILGINKGSLSPGTIGDVVLVDLNEYVTVDSRTFHSKGKSTPFDGKTYQGAIKYTIKEGKIVYDYNS